MAKDIIEIKECKDFEELRSFCEALEKEGYKLNVADCCYER